jgi:glycosyltransferase involved in cell wall biosynthesis
MKIGVSAFAGDAGKSGISQYMINIFKRLPELSGDDEYVMFMSRSDRQHFDFDHERVRVVALPDWCGHALVNIAWHLVLLPWMLYRHKCDCVYLPAGNRRLAWWYGVPSIGTVHDLSQLHVKGKYDAFRMFYCKRILPFLIRRLDRVIAVSGATSRDLQTYAGVPADVIDVVYNGADLDQFKPDNKALAGQRVRQKYGINTPYILYTARLEHPGKNHVRLLEAFANLKRDQHIPHHLILAGSPWFGAETIYAAARDLGVTEHVIFAGFVPNEELPDLYAGADLFAFPSLFEGFGIPLLEAMASGTPVCASNVASIPEVVQDAGLLFEPTRVEDIQAAIQRLAGDDAFRQQLATLGIAQSQRFSWDDSAQRVWEICHAAVSTSNVTPGEYQVSE